MATALVSSLVLRWWQPFSGNQPVVFAKTALTTTAITTLVWVIVTLLTRPEPEPVLVKFYRQVRPHVAGWSAIALLAPEITPTRDLGRNLVSWVLGCAMVYSALFGTGWLILGPPERGTVFLLIAGVCGATLIRHLSERAGQKI